MVQTLPNGRSQPHISPSAFAAYRQRHTPPPSSPGTVQTIAAVTQPRRLRVAAYCRVSTDMPSQEQSLENQEDFYRREINANPDWDFAGVYIDDGVTGTKAEVRPELQRLLQDCRDGKIDLILTKSISRFARNTVDCVSLVRELKSLGVNIQFAKEGLDSNNEFLLTLLAETAANESKSISGNIKWSIRKKFQDGTYKASSAPFGYAKQDDKLIIQPEQAEIVRRIFSMVLSGSGMNRIAAALNADNIPSPTGKKWTEPSLRLILSNPVYKGDVLYQKKYRDDTYTLRKNTGELDSYYNADHHEPIISSADFDRAQEALSQRAKEVGYITPECRSGNHYPFTGILICSSCGSIMHRSGDDHWICHEHIINPDLCSMKPQSDGDLRSAFVNCLNKLSWAQSKMRLLDEYESLLGRTEAEKNAERLAEIDGLLTQNKSDMAKLNAVIMRERFLPAHREKMMLLQNQEKELMSEKNKILLYSPGGTLQDLKRFVNGWRITDDVGMFPEKEFSEFVENCTVDSSKNVVFHFTCGLKLTESLVRDTI